MKVYRVKCEKLSGTDYREVYHKAYSLYKPLKARTKRRPHIRSAYFMKDKIFLGLFWQHIDDKTNFRDKIRRLKFFPCALELIRNSKFEPTSKQNPNNPSEILHRLGGLTKDSELFFVQIKEDKKSGQKWFLSVFPEET